MNNVKKILGVLWIALGLVAAYYIIKFMAIAEINKGKGENIIAASVYFFLVPVISLSLIIFGYYAIINEFDDKEIN